MLQHHGDFRQQQGINALALKDGINTRTLMVDPPRKFRNGHPAFIKNEFDEVSYMDAGLLGHDDWCFSENIKKAWKFFLLDTPGYHTLQSNKFIHGRLETYS